MKEIDQVEGHPFRYSICTLVSDREEYAQMAASFKQAGFTEDACEYLYVDNASGNKYDAYEGLNRLLQAARGQYVIFCHEDVRLEFDRRGDLDARLREMDDRDPLWGVLGNAGGSHNLAKRFMRISDPHGENLTLGVLPCRVRSLDENFFLLKKEANLGFSRDIKGFHFYGTDICLLAEILGYYCYVIDFHLRHKSPGRGKHSPAFEMNRRNLVEKYGRALRPRLVRTPCTRLFISRRSLFNRLLNTDFVMKKILKKLYKWRILR